MTGPLRALLGLLLVLPAGAAAAAPKTLDHDMEARLDPGSGRLEIRDVITVSGRRTVVFRIAPWLEIDQARLDGRDLEPELSAGVLRVGLPDRSAHSLDLRLRGRVPPPAGSAGRGSSALPVSGPEGSYLPGHAAWVPWMAGEAAAYRLAVAVPEAYRAVATGRLEEERVEDGVYRAVFAADRQSEPPSLFAGPYEIGEDRAGDIRLRTYFHPEVAALSEAYLRASAEYLRRFQRQIGPYPFADFHVISAPLPVGLGFPNLTYVGRRILPLPFMKARSLAHEVLHNWWGNGVAVDYDGGNWAEGLTTYMADYALVAEQGPDKAREMRLGWLRDYAALPPDRDQALVDFTSKRHDAGQVVGYNKVAFVFHMLKAEIGEDAFYRALKDVWRRKRLETAGWGDLQAAFEAASRRDLSWFFAQWLRRVGAPRPRIESARWNGRGEAGEIALAVVQDAPAYRLSIPVEIETATGRQRETIRLEGERTTATLATGDAPLALHLDPDHDVFRLLLPGEAPPILRDVTLSSETLTIVAVEGGAAERAARDLAERLLDTAPRYGGPADIDRSAAPLLVVGLTEAVAPILARLGLAEPPEAVAGRGTARVWTARRPDQVPVAVVMAEDAAALEALRRPLPHYGGKSYLVFDGRRAIDRGVWPGGGGPMTRRFGQ